MNTEGDRLSSLSYDLIIKILSYNNDTKGVVRTSILSSRWKNIWKSVPLFDLSIDDFTSLTGSHEVSRYLSSRNNEIELSSVKLSVRGGFSQTFVKTVINYAFSHNVQKMTIICLDEAWNEIPISLFISQSLKDLTLIGSCTYKSDLIESSWDLPALTTLHLENLRVSNEEYGGLFYKCPNLKNLTLSNCTMNDSNLASICYSNLTVENGSYSVAYVVAPYLKNLTIVNCRCDLFIYAPELSSLMYKNLCYRHLFAHGLSSLEKLNFSFTHPDEAYGPAIIKILQQFCNVKYLTLGLEIVEEVKALKDGTSAQRIMAKLQVMLEREKINCEMNMNEQGETQINEGHHVKKKISQIRSCWMDLFGQFNEDYVKIDEILLMLDQIEVLVQGLPTSKKDSIQAQFSSLRAEANSVMKLILDRMKIKCDGKVSAFVNLL